MYRPIPVEEVIAAMPKERQEAIAKRGAELVAKVRRRMTLAELRKGARLARQQLRRLWESARCRFRGWRSAKIRACPRWRALWRRWAGN